MTQPWTFRSALNRAQPILLVALATLSVCAVVVRFTSIAQPLGIDQGLWASAARGLARGQLLYRDVWEQRPPGIYFIYVAGFELFGWTAAAVAWMDGISVVLTAVLLAAVARALADRLTAATATALYATLTMPAWLYGHAGFLERSVCETFIVLAVSFSAWCAVTFRNRPHTAWAFAAGVSAGAAVVLKPNAAVYFLAIFGWVLLDRRRDRRSIDMRWPLAVAVVGTAIIPAMTLAWLWRLGLLGDARTAVVDFNRYYIGQGFTVQRYMLDFSRAVWLRIKTDPLWFAGAVGAVATVRQIVRHRGASPLASLAMLWGGAAAIAIVVNGARLFNSYFIQAQAPLALLAAWMLREFGRGTARERLAAIATGVVMLVMLVEGHYATRVFGSARADVALLSGRMERAAYLERFGGYQNQRGFSARANEELEQYVHARTAPDERVFLFGINGAGVYFGADRLTAHPFLRVNFFVATDFPNPRFRLESVTDALTASRPRYMIFERLHSTSEMGRAVDRLLQQPPVRKMLAGYRFEKQIEDFTLFRRMDGDAPVGSR